MNCEYFGCAEYTKKCEEYCGAQDLEAQKKAKCPYLELEIALSQPGLNELGLGYLGKLAFVLCQEIEGFPASEQQTKVSIMAHELFKEIKNQEASKKEG